MKIEIKIFGDIGPDIWGMGGNTAESITARIDTATAQDEIVLRINSFGGSATDGIAIYNALRKTPAKTTAIVEGVAMSAATLILLGANVRIGYQSSVLMVHNPFWLTIGNADELEKSAEDLRVFENAGKAIYLERLNIDAEKLDSILSNETFLNASDALELRLLTEIDSQLTSPATENASALSMAMMSFTKRSAAKMQAFLAEQKAKAEAPTTQATEKVEEVETVTTEEVPAVVETPVETPVVQEAETVSTEETTKEETPVEQPVEEKVEEAQASADAEKARATSIKEIYASANRNDVLSEMTINALADGMTVEEYKTAVINALATAKPIQKQSISASLFRAPVQEAKVNHADVYAKLKSEDKKKASAYFVEHKSEIMRGISTQ